MNRTAVVTGMGVVARNAIGIPAFRQLLASGGTGPGRPRQFDASRFRAGKGYETDPVAVRQALGDALARRGPMAGGRPVTEADMDCAGYGLLAAIEAIEQAGIAPAVMAKAGCSVATTSGGMMDRYTDALSENADTGPYETHVTPGSSAVVLAEVLGADGPLCSFSCACASSLGALSYALMRIRRGDAPVMIVGGTDRMREADFAGFNALRAMDRDLCRPFDVNRRGMMIGDGAAMLVIEDADHAARRGAVPLARMASVALATDSHHITCPKPEGLTRAMQQALHHAGLRPEAISYVNCHGTGTPINDEAEVIALETVFGGCAERPIISSTKGTTGHLLGSAGAIEAVATLLALRDREAPRMTTTSDPERIAFPLPLTAGGRALRTDFAMSNSLGFGGLNGSVIFERFHGGAA